MAGSKIFDLFYILFNETEKKNVQITEDILYAPVVIGEQSSRRKLQIKCVQKKAHQINCKF